MAINLSSDSRTGVSALALSDSHHDRERIMSFHCFAFGSRSLKMHTCFSGETSHGCGHAYRTSRGTLTSPVEGSSLTIRVISTAGCPRHLLATMSMVGMIRVGAHSTYNMKRRGIGKQWNCWRSCFVACISQENCRISAI